MKTIRHFLRTNAMTLYWVAALILHVTLFSYATEQVGIVPQPEKQAVAPAGEYGGQYAASLITDSLEPPRGAVLSRLNDVDPSVWADGFVVMALFLTGSAFWQATARIRRENEDQLLVDEFTDSWRTDSLLLTYLTLLILQIGLIAVISFTPVSVYTFWIGYAGVLLGQQTPAGRRIGEGLLRTFESRSNPATGALH